MLETIGFSLLVSAGLLASIKTGGMNDRNKIEKIFEYSGIVVKGLNGEVKQCKFIKQNPIKEDEKEIGTEYIYKLPLGIPYMKLEHMNDNIGIFKDGLNKNVELDYHGGVLHVYVYNGDLPKNWDYRQMGKNWQVLIGRTYKENVLLDFDQTQNMIGGGSVRYGKTNLIKVIMTSLILNNPNDVELFLIDLKAGVEFERYRNLKQVKDVATTPLEAHQLLFDVMVLLEARQKHFKGMGWNNVVESPYKKRTFVIIDEAGDLVPEKFMQKKEKDMYEECQWMLSHIARIGPAFGFRELFFSQYVTGDVLPRVIKQVSDAKICFKIQNDYASEVVLGRGNTQAAYLPRIRGRAYFMDGPDLFELQVPYISDTKIKELLAEHYERKDVTNEGRENPSPIIEARDVET